MWWKKNKTFTKQVLKDANLDVVPFVKERFRSDFAKTLLESLPIEQHDLGNQIDFQADALLLTLPQWEAIKMMLQSLPESSLSVQQETITQIIESVETK